MPARLLMVVPTYDEVDNVARIVGRIRAAVPGSDVLVVDDGSPDGTGEVADALAAEDPHVHVLHRSAKEGLGRAYVAGFAWGLAHTYDAIGEIDADGSHAPDALPDLLAALEDADLVVGSRWVPGGSVVDWPLRRRLLSRGGNLYVRLLLGVPLRDATAGYRVFRRTTLESIDLETVHSTGYVFQADLAFRTLKAGLRVVEVPIRFVERTHGDSKMTPEVAAESLRLITRWGVRERREQLRAWGRSRLRHRGGSRAGVADRGGRDAGVAKPSRDPVR